MEPLEPQDSALPEFRVVALEYVQIHAGDLAMGVLAAMLVSFAVEAMKPLLRLAIARLGLQEDTADAILKTIPYLLGVPCSWLLRFDTHWLSMTGSQLDSVSALIVGGLLTGGAAQLGYHLGHRFQVVKTLQIRWNRMLGITQEDLASIRVASQSERRKKD